MNTDPQAGTVHWARSYTLTARPVVDEEHVAGVLRAFDDPTLTALKANGSELFGTVVDRILRERSMQAALVRELAQARADAVPHGAFVEDLRRRLPRLTGKERVDAEDELKLHQSQLDAAKENIESVEKELSAV